MSGEHTPGPWGVEQTSENLWVGPLRADGHKVDEVVVYLSIERDLTVAAALRRYHNARLIAAAPDLLTALHQYANDLRYPPAADSIPRRLAMVEALIKKASGHD